MKLVEEIPYGEYVTIECSNCGTKGEAKNVHIFEPKTLFIDCNCDLKYYQVVKPNRMENIRQVLMSRENLSSNEANEKIQLCLNELFKHITNP